MPVDLTIEEVRQSPDVDTDLPAYRQQEIAMTRHYCWPAYWTMEASHLSGEKIESEGDPNLRSANEILTYKVKTSDGDLGRMDDLVVEDANWFIRFLVLNASSWFEGQALLVATRWGESDVNGGIWGASRHALTVGFLSTMVFAIGQRILPAFCGARVLYSPRPMLVSLAALNIGCVLRVAAEIPACEANIQMGWHLLRCSAVIELLAVSLFALNLALTLLQPPAHLRPAVTIS